MKYCHTCSNKLSIKTPTNDDRERFVCESCGEIHYQNPNIIVCSLPCYEDQVLLCKRSIEPRYGLWTLPGGFMENNETTHEGASRETLEEACARIKIHGLYTYYSLPYINQVHMFFRATLLDLNFSAGAESLEVELFKEKDIPWDEIAFPAVSNTLIHYYNDLPGNIFPVHSADIILTKDKQRLIVPHNSTV